MQKTIKKIIEKTLKKVDGFYSKEAVDLIWTAYGFLHLLGVDPDEAFDRIYASNQTKIPFEFKDGKVQKGKNYVPPVLSDL